MADRPGGLCSHIAEQRDLVMESYKIVISFLISPESRENLEKRVQRFKCYTCESVGARCRLHACLQCCYVGCRLYNHSQEHHEESNHHVAISLSHGVLYCYLCAEYVHDYEFDIIAIKARQRLADFLDLNEFVRSVPLWNPKYGELELLSLQPKRMRVDSKTPIGLRGLYNLGNTCFMNCIIQCLTHTPFLREYFLSQQHKCIRSSPADCLVCEMCSIFQEFYSGKIFPHVPTRLLYLVWTHAQHLAGYEQQDAHEFFMATLNLVHKHASGTDIPYSGGCNCIIDVIFTGSLQSDVVCQSCHGVSTTIEPFWDISLDLGQQTAGDSRKPRSLDRKKLTDCLENFTRAEHLGSAAKIKCSKCNSYQESTKQLTFKKLPLVVSFHLKRFEHSKLLHKKVSTPIAFPQQLDLSPYMAKPEEQEEADPTSTSHDPSFSRPHTYSLFGVVIHQGTLQTGHYTAYIRQSPNGWFKCDDCEIKTATIEEVLNCEAYLLFYHKKYIEYAVE
ncbi:ubiquitin carboxyl-terminal hydrolase 22 [Galendromus occidentalis]|uniref:Ubiquitin carboxyl-terminal hydrolase n=1 Tax=Galendromus occidentalis TaxID=34638 RepID=A0AAJ7L4J3_9ACAR|nr:ubiquitin carboxyl-terminal hydrolase 22 [Galendromus occidentalis]